MLNMEVLLSPRRVAETYLICDHHVLKPERLWFVGRCPDVNELLLRVDV